MCLSPATAAPPDPCVLGKLTPQYDPVDRVVVWVPQEPLTPQTRYIVRLVVPKRSDDPNGLRAFDGVPLEEEFTFVFTTGDAAATAMEPKRDVSYCFRPPQFCEVPSDPCKPPVPVGATKAGPNQFFISRCLLCHGVTPFGPPSGNALKLTNPGAVRQLVETAQIATETATGPDPSVPASTGKDVFGQNMPYIDPNNPGNSFLLYKIIIAAPPRCPYRPDEDTPNPNPAACVDGGGYADPSGFTADLYPCTDFPDASSQCASDAGVPVPATKAASFGQLVPAAVESWVQPDQWKPPTGGEYARLRSRIRGEQMPYPSGTTSTQEARDISAWIAAGAIVDDCPP
jgi:hypothetical protein